MPVRDEEAAGSNPATPTKLLQVKTGFPESGIWLVDHLTAI